MAKKSKEGRDVPHLRIRLSPQLLARLEKAREKTHRTMNGEIAARLESSFLREDQETLVHQVVDQTLEALGILRTADDALRAMQGAPASPSVRSNRGVLGDLPKPSDDKEGEQSS